MKSLYNEKDDTYLKEAFVLDAKTQGAIQPIFDEYVKLGYSTRQISHIMTTAVWECELMHMFNRK
jgi:hypothetical protein